MPAKKKSPTAMCTANTATITKTVGLPKLLQGRLAAA